MGEIVGGEVPRWTERHRPGRRAGLRRALGWALCLAPVLLAAGCSGMAQRMGTRYVTRQLDDVFDLDDAQEDRVHASIGRLIDEVPVIVEPGLARLVASVDRVLRDGATEASLRAIERQGDALADRVAARVIVEVAPLLASLSDAQIDHARGWVDEQLEERREELRVTPAERREERQDRFVEAVEEWTGDISRMQEAALRTHVLGQPDEARPALAVAERRLAAFEGTLRAHPGAASLQAELARLWSIRDDLGPEGESAAERRARARATLLFLDDLVTPAQRTHAREHLAAQYARIRRVLGDAG